MSKPGKCPYCDGKGKKIKARVAGQPSHLAYGYGEQTFRCTNCGENWSQCYPVPPKGHPRVMDAPNPGILNVSFGEGTTGFAGGIVLKAKSAVFIERQDAETISEDTGSGEVASG